MNYCVTPERLPTGLVKKTETLLKAFFTLALMLVLNAANAQSPEVRKAFRLIDIEQPSKGIAALQQVASAGDNEANQYYLGLGYLRLDSADKEKALAAFEKGIGMAGKRDAMSLVGKGHVRLLEKKDAEAKAIFNEAIDKSKGKDGAVYRAIGEAYLSDSKYVVDAINALNKAKELDGGHPDTHLLLGKAYLMQNNGGESVSSYERAASADKSWAKPFVKIAEVYQRSKNYDMVFENLNKAIAVDAEYAPAYKELGELHYVRKEAAKAVDAYEKYLAITETPGDAKYQLAFFYFMAKDYAKSNAIFKEVTSSPNASPVAIKYYAYAKVESDTTKAGQQEAKQLFDTYFERAKPENIQPSDYAYYGRLLLNLDQDSLANESFAKSLDMDSAQFDVMKLHADTYMDRKKYVESAEVYKEMASMREQPMATDYWMMGQGYYFGDKYVEADSAFSKVIEIQGEKTPAPVYLFAARARANVDSTMTEGLAKSMYDTYLQKALEKPEQNKRSIIEAYEYLGAYYIHKEENVNTAKTYYQKILALDPGNQEAKKFIETINQPATQQKGGR